MHGTVNAISQQFAAEVISVAGKVSVGGSLVNERGFHSVTIDGANFMLVDPFLPANRLTILAKVGLGPRTRLQRGFEPLYSGVIGAAFLARSEDNCLLQIADDAAFHILFKDGRVAKVECKALQAAATFLSPQETLSYRLAQAAEMFKRAESATDVVVKQNRTFFELARLLRFSANFPEMRKQITQAIGCHTKLVAGGKLHPEVVRKFTVVLNFIGENPREFWWVGNFNEGQDWRQTADAAVVVEKKVSSKAAEKARKQRRSEESRTERDKMKGVARSDDSKGHKSKKK